MAHGAFESWGSEASAACALLSSLWGETSAYEISQGVLRSFLCQCYCRGMSCGVGAALCSRGDAHQQHLFQVLLCNPICVVGYALASWRFFRERIEEEEITLIHFFGEEYLEYKRKVPSGLPFIKGVKLEL